jgi:hypothetical protein
MENQLQQPGNKQVQPTALADIFASAAEQLAAIIYETIRTREINKADHITMPPFEPSVHTQ